MATPQLAFLTAAQAVHDSSHSTVSAERVAPYNRAVRAFVKRTAYQHNNNKR